MKRCIIPLVAGCLLLAQAAQAEIRYRFILLGPPGTVDSWAINDHGVIVGQCSVPPGGTAEACIIDRTGCGNNILLGYLGVMENETSHARDVSNDGVIVGYVQSYPSYETRTVKFDPTGGGANIDLSTPGGPSSEAHAVADIGDDLMIGGLSRIMGSTYPTHLDPTGGGANTILGDRAGVLLELNSSGVGAGQAVRQQSPFYYVAKRFDPDGTIVELGTLGGANSKAFDINDAGQIVGWAQVHYGGNDYERAVLFDASGGGANIQLGPDFSDARAINNDGVIVGHRGEAVLYEEDPPGTWTMTPLEDLIDPALTPGLNIPADISNNGWIIGDASWGRFLLIPVTEPDFDEDYSPDAYDNCPDEANQCQEDVDEDGVGDACDLCPGFDDNLDADGDEVPDGCDVCPGFDDAADADSDGTPDGCDLCPYEPALTEPLSDEDTVCDGIDEDCDDTGDGTGIDDDYVVDDTCGVGHCQATNTPSSCAGGAETPCEPGPPLSSEDTVCDGLDEDCDGPIDEDYVSDDTCGVGHCQATNTPSSCAGGAETPCEPGAPLSSEDTVCDGVDEDCDGPIDEDYPIDDTCGVGECQANNTPSSCTGGVETLCAPGTPSPEICDELDNDCDGTPDQLGTCCEVIADCSDLDVNTIRDDMCLWWECVDTTCQWLEIVFADYGGTFGACRPDGVTDNNDQFHALNCFGNQSTTGIPGEIYPCEDDPPYAQRVDVASLGAPCTPDGVCDANEAYAALNAFEGQSPCVCDHGEAPQPAAPVTRSVTEQAAIRLLPSARVMHPGDLVAVDVLLAGRLQDLRGYQLHLGVTGGAAGGLLLRDIEIQPRKDGVFAGLAPWSAFNVDIEQMLSGLSEPGIAAPRGAYLATFVYQATPDAQGRFAVELLHDPADDTQRTILFPTPAAGMIGVQSAAPAAVQVVPRQTKAAR